MVRGHSRWMAVAQPLLTTDRRRLIGAGHPRRSGAPYMMGPSLKQREGLDDPNLGLNLARQTVARARDGEMASPNLSGSSGLLQ
jgi:hypothetical protein